jgi:NitT/TauT family transport system ATP-binding protein
MIHVDGLIKRFGKLTVLDGIDHRQAPAEAVVLIGPSGCGKSTFLRCLAGLDAPSAGRLTLAGKPITAPPPQLGIALQRDALLDWLDVLDNVLLPADFAGLPRARHEPRARELLAMVGLAEFAHAWPAQLSGGMRQRVAICRCLLLDPPLLLMDEPFGALDAMTRDDMSIELLRIWGEISAARKTILFVTHSIPEAVFLSDRVVVMSARPGRIAADFKIDLPRPRTVELRGTEAFAHLNLEIFKTLTGRVGQGIAV